MKLRNRKTGEVGILIVDGAYKFVTNFAVEDNKGNRLNKYDSLAELNEEWEDYEEPKEHWIINSISSIETTDRDETDEPGRAMIEIGNYFETKEEAEKAVEKLKAFKRLKDKGLRFEGYEAGSVTGIITEIVVLLSPSGGKNIYLNDYVKSDLDLLFSGDEE